MDEIIRAFVTTIALKDRRSRTVLDASEIIGTVRSYLTARAIALREPLQISDAQLDLAVQIYHTVRRASARRARIFQQQLFTGVSHGRTRDLQVA